LCATLPVSFDPCSRPLCRFQSAVAGGARPEDVRILVEIRIIHLHFAADNLHSILFLVGSVKRFFPQECFSAIQGH